MQVYCSMRRWSLGVGTAAAMATLGVVGAQQPRNGTPANGNGAAETRTATATVRDASGKEVGRAELTETPNGVLIYIPSLSAPPGPHAFHIHETGRCGAPSFDSAGDHFNPDRAEHGYENARGPHAGDLPNVHVPESGKVDVEFIAPDVTLEPGQGSLLDADGSALVLHTGRDNYFSDPAGDAGGRHACGVIER